MSLFLQPLDLKMIGWPAAGATDQPEGFDSNKNHLATPLTKLTENSLDGGGTFDVLMQSVKKHLKQEFSDGRIVGKEYSTVYLGALTAVLQTAAQVLVNEQQAHKTSAEIGLIRQKIVTELAQTDDSIPIGLGFNHYDKENNCITPINCSEKDAISCQSNYYSIAIEALDNNQTPALTSVITLGDSTPDITITNDYNVVEDCPYFTFKIPFDDTFYPMDSYIELLAKNEETGQVYSIDFIQAIITIDSIGSEELIKDITALGYRYTFTEETGYKSGYILITMKMTDFNPGLTMFTARASFG